MYGELVKRPTLTMEERNVNALLVLGGFCHLYQKIFSLLGSEVKEGDLINSDDKFKTRVFWCWS